MARRPLYPATPGETAIDRLLNQTIPNVINAERDRQEREEIRAEDLRRYNEDMRYRAERDGVDDFRKFKTEFDTGFSNVKKAILTNDYDLAKVELDALTLSVNDPTNAKHMTEEYRNRYNNLTQQIDSQSPLSDELDKALEGMESGQGTEQQIYDWFSFINKNKSNMNSRQNTRFSTTLSQNQGSPAYSFIMNNLGFYDKLNELGADFYQLKALNTKQSFEELSISEREFFADSLPMDLQIPKPGDPAHALKREQAMRDAFERQKSQSVPEAANNYFSNVLSLLGGQKGIENFINVNAKDLPYIQDDFRGDIFDAADMATQGKADRPDAGDPEKLANYFAEYAISQGIPRSVLFGPEQPTPVTPPAKKTTSFDYDRVFETDLEDMSPTAIVTSMISAKNDADFIQDGKPYLQPYISQAEKIALQLDRELKVLSGVEFPTQNQKDQIARLQEMLGQSDIASALKKLNNRQYMQRRAKGGFVQNKRLEKAQEQIEANNEIDKKIVAAQKILDTGTYEMRQTFLDRDEGQPIREYNIPEAMQKDIKRVNRGRESALNPKREDSIRDYIRILELQKSKNLSQIDKIAKRLVKNYNLLTDYEVMTIVNQNEEGTQDLDYRLMRRGK